MNIPVLIKYRYLFVWRNSPGHHTGPTRWSCLSSACSLQQFNKLGQQCNFILQCRYSFSHYDETVNIYVLSLQGFSYETAKLFLPVLRSRHFFGRLWLWTFEVSEPTPAPTKSGQLRLQAKKAARAPYTNIFHFELWSELLMQVFFGSHLPL